MSNIIDKIQLSGVTYTLSGTSSGGTNAVEVTQAEYDALVSGGTVDPTVFYIITDATPIDVSTFVTSGQMTSAITQATSGKVNTSSVVSSVTSGSTDSEIPTAKAVYDAIPTGGTSITIDPSLDSGSTNPVANSAITNAFNNVVNVIQNYDNGHVRWYDVKDYKNTYKYLIYNFSINGRMPLSKQNGTDSNVDNFNLVETSAITSSVTSASTDNEIPTAKAVFDAIPTGGTGGGKAISAGTNISVTTGETADTINCTLNLVNGTNSTSGGLVLKSYAAGNEASGRDATAFGGGNKANGTNSFVCGYYNTGNTSTAFVTGNNNITTNQYESLFGLWSLSNGNVTNDFTGNSGATMFAVGNGEWRQRIRHNAFEVRQNGDIYIADTNDTSTSNFYEKPMIKLQDTVSATTANTTALGGLKLVKLTQSAYDALSPNYDSNTLYIIKD